MNLWNFKTEKARLEKDGIIINTELDYEGRVRQEDITRLFSKSTDEEVKEKVETIKAEKEKLFKIKNKAAKEYADGMYYYKAMEKVYTFRRRIATEKRKRKEYRENLTIVTSVSDKERLNDLSESIVVAIENIITGYGRFRGVMFKSKLKWKKDFIDECLRAEIKPQDLTAFQYMYVNNLSTKDISRLEGVSEAAIRTRAGNIRKKLGHPAHLKAMFDQIKIETKEDNHEIKTTPTGSSK